MKNIRKFAASALALCVLCACIPFCAQAVNAYGDNVFLRVDPDTDTYTFYGSGEMYDYERETETTQQTYSRVVIEAGVSYVGAHLFDDDTIGELVLPDTPLAIHTEAFSGSTIRRVTFPQTAEDAAQYDFGDEYTDFGGAYVLGLDLGGLDGFPNGFRFCSGDNYTLQSLTVGARTAAIPDNACNCFGALESLTLPDGLLSIGIGAFESCECLQAVRIPDSVTRIDDYAFDYCTALTDLTLPKRLQTVGDWAFCNCNGLTSVTFPGRTRSIGISAFEDCSNLASVTIPDSVTRIGINAFGRTALQNVHLPATLEMIDATSLGDSLSYVCCSTEDCPVIRQFCADAGVEFRLCDGHGIPARVAGDADGDGSVTLRDAVVMQRYLAGGWDVTVDEDAADVDGDGAVSLADVVLLCRYLAGGWDAELL